MVTEGDGTDIVLPESIHDKLSLSIQKFDQQNIDAVASFKRNSSVMEEQPQPQSPDATHMASEKHASEHLKSLYDDLAM